ncbi:hypothetical protein [Algimonas arctica]|nr:hypothetical protein [Algimonas arctica]
MSADVRHVSMIYIMVVPFYAHFAVLHFLDVSERVDIPFLNFVWKVVSITLIPATLGLLANTLYPSIANKVKGIVKIGGTSVLVVAFGVILVDQIPVLKLHFRVLFGITLAMNLVTLIAAIALTRMMKLAPKERVAIGIEHIMRQEGTAIYIAVTIFASREMSLPMIMNTPVALIVGIALVVVSRRYLNRKLSVSV